MRGSVQRSDGEGWPRLPRRQVFEIAFEVSKRSSWSGYSLSSTQGRLYQVHCCTRTQHKVRRTEKLSAHYSKLTSNFHAWRSSIYEKVSSGSATPQMRPVYITL